ncbi:MAG: CvpA family protein [Clostridia bacterium]|nr:CvpA family protein [Clostridia bacterium]
MNIIIDLIIVAIVIVTALISAKYGFIRTAIEIVGFIAIIFIINSSSLAIAGGIYDNLIDKKIVSATENVAVNTENSSEEFWNSLPEFIKKEDGIFGVKKETIINGFNNHLASGIKQTTSSISKDLIRPTVIKPLSLLVSLIMFLVLNPIVHFVAKAINGVVKKSFVKGINSKLGFIIGLPKGLIYALIFVVMLLILVNLYPNGIWLINKNNVDNSYIVGIISKYLPKNGIFEFILKV